MTKTQQTPPLPAITGFGHTRDGRTLYTVASRSKPGQFHIVTQHDRGQDKILQCDCEAAKYGKICAHSQVIRERLSARRQVTATTAEYREPSFRDSAPLFRDNKPFSIFKS